MSNSIPSMCESPLVAPFINSLIRLIEEQDDSIIHWSPSGESFVICNVSALSHVLPHYFKTSNFNSFVRQLNFYNFRKSTNVRSRNHFEFKHALFHRDHPENYSYIYRKTSSEGMRSHDDEIVSLRAENERLAQELEYVKKQLMEAQAACDRQSSIVMNENSAPSSHKRVREGPSEAIDIECLPPMPIISSSSLFQDFSVFPLLHSSMSLEIPDQAVFIFNPVASQSSISRSCSIFDDESSNSSISQDEIDNNLDCSHLDCNCGSFECMGKLHCFTSRLSRSQSLCMKPNSFVSSNSNILLMSN